MPYNSFSTSIVQVNSQLRDGMSQCDRCSRNSACACFHLPGASNTGICTDRYAVTCSELVPCNPTTNHCSQSDHTCVHHPQCRDIPVCYPVPDYNKQFCQPMSSDTIGEVVAGGNGKGNGLNPLKGPRNVQWPNELFVDALGTLYVVATSNNRLMRWPQGAKEGTVAVGGNGQGAEANQFNGPKGLSFDRHGNLYISDSNNHRVQRFSIE
ncbi:unnamed protein product [Rotaria socialis]|uniref:Uncharacterized protein n=1 Tax=Rotaria socialis TaxID=392032 RepID=A0A818ETK5_9BILA|nr:unnamed protein product [Rotaria socialis]CAF4362509.1 unnamed protein product [Rotaria socialis]